MKNITFINKEKGKSMESAIKRRFPFANKTVIDLLMIELKGIINPVIYGLNTQVKELECEIESVRDDAMDTRDRIEWIEESIEHMKAEQERQKMLTQFYSY